ncbi:MAG: GGDEF domain-containing protein [Elainellaceae cyanobacterium]
MPTSNLECLLRETLVTLHQTVGFDLWMITHVDGKDRIIMQVDDHSYGVEESSIFNWLDSCCYQMVLGSGPFIAPTAQSVDAYMRVLIGEHLKIGAYAGVPLVSKNGNLRGTLCAIHPESLPQSVESHLPLIIAISKLIAALLDAHSEIDAATEQATEIETLLFRDSLTGAFNRHAWNKLLATEEENCKFLGQSACVISIGLNNLKRINDIQGYSAGDSYMRRAAKIIRGALDRQYVGYLARVDGDKFAVLCVGCSHEQGEQLIDSIKARLNRSQISSSARLAVWKPHLRLLEAWKQADLSVGAFEKIK